MTFIIDGTAGATFPNGTNPQAAPSKVLQVVQFSSTSQVSTTSTSLVSTGFAASITPLFSTSKILVSFSAASLSSSGETAMSIYRGGSPITSPLKLSTSGSTNWLPTNFTILDSPATTSSTTYTLYYNVVAGTIYVGTGGSSPTVTITLMEIGQ